jgi:multidrug efflux pump subunit AcrB
MQLRLTEGDRTEPSTIARLYVPRQGGTLVRLDNLVRFVPALSASCINRSDRQREARLRPILRPAWRGSAGRRAAEQWPAGVMTLRRHVARARPAAVRMARWRGLVQSSSSLALLTTRLMSPYSTASWAVIQ